MQIFIRCADCDVTEGDLSQAFEKFGNVEYAELLTLVPNGDTSGVGCVEMPDTHEAVNALELLADVMIGGLPVNLDEPRTGTGRRTGRERRDAARAAVSERRVAPRRTYARLVT